MADAMVTARMPIEKKEAGNRVLEQLGTNASQAVNRFYDYLIREHKLPFENEPTPHTHTPEEIAAAKAWADSLRVPIEDARFAEMTVKQAKIERLIAKGFITREEVQA